MPNVVRARLGLLRETFPGERRVALTPGDVRALSERMSIRFQRGCGAGAGHTDDAYVAAGALPAVFEELVSLSKIIVGVRRPEETGTFESNSVLAYLGSGAGSPANSSRGGPLHLDLARISGMRDAGRMDVSSRQAAITGHVAVLEATRELGLAHAMLTVDGNFVRPIAMVAIGTDPAALQAIATAKRLGAKTHGFGFEQSAQQKIERLGARFLGADLAYSSTDIFVAQSTTELAILRRQLATCLSNMQLIVTSVAPTGEPAPILLDDEMLSALHAGTIIVDLAAENGGNCASTHAGQTVDVSNVRIVGSTTLASRAASEASCLFSEGLRNLIEHLLDINGHLRFDRLDPLIRAMIGDQPIERSIAS
ncbi:NAD/NADP transhydrogenase subunit alpha [Rhizobium sp. Root1220]|uniref:NAD/NADP transhydrogenase subunit alpha n=1 Tax=Rhizobium sp. Root1220 TaxID=1736432 RepID=UPI0006FA3D91|nr:NAD/NADP transhydrogenase subunit alpha [Rhizobium sp. Root1220]KQV83823.1 NAD/NADP transhydrogenase subunit alpha [Rhizobium sp. Root1220]